MKTAVTVFSNGDIKKTSESVFNALADIKTDYAEILSFEDDLLFSRRLEEFIDTVDNLIIFAPKELKFDIRAIIAEKLNCSLVESETAISLIAESGDLGLNENFSLIPESATLIPNHNGAFQGFMFEDDQITVVLLPSEEKEYKPMCEEFLTPYFNQKYKKERVRVLKYFGEEEKVLNANEIIKRQFEYDFSVRENCKDCKITLTFSDKEDEENVIKAFYANLDNIYSAEDLSLSETLLKLLDLSGKKVSTAESFTGGRVVSEMIKISGASKYVHEGIVSYSNLSKMERLNVKRETLDTVGAVSAQVAYQMAIGLLHGETDLAITTTGIAGPKSDDTKKPVGLCYIGIGTKDAVHTYKYNFTGNRERITETAKNTALFLAIKKLKNI